MLDINGQELRAGAAAQLLCEVLAIEDDCVRVRVMNSELEILVGTKYDEVLGGWVADSELTAFEQLPVPSTQLPEKCLCILGCSVNGACPVHGDGGHLPTSYVLGVNVFDAPETLMPEDPARRGSCS